MKKPSIAPMYAALYPGLCEVARSMGYALAIHGTLTRDVDLIAVPWVDDVSPVESLIDALFARIALCVDGTCDQVDGPECKPRGRQAWTICIDHGASIDISVIGHNAEMAGRDSERSADSLVETQVDDLAMLVRRLVHEVRKTNKESSVAIKAVDYLKRKGLQGSPIREINNNLAGSTKEIQPEGSL